MEILGTLIVCVIVLVIMGWVSGRRKAKQAKQKADRYLTEVDAFVRIGEPCTVVLADGKRFEHVKLLGYSQFHDNLMNGGIYPAHRWLVVELPNAGRVFLRPPSIRYIEQSPPGK